MAGRAEWRRLPDDPRSEWGWRAREGRRWAGLGLRRARGGFVGLSLVAGALGHGLPAALLMVTALSLGALGGAVLRAERGPPVAEPSPGQAFVGRVELAHDGAWLGEDRVVATFVDGWLHVEGLRTDFALRSEEAREIKGSVLTLADGTALRFEVDLGPRDRSRDDFHLTVDGASFERRLQRWAIEPIPPGVAVLPPAHPHPSARARAGADLAVATLALGAGVAVAWSVGLAWGLVAFLLVPGPTLDRALASAVRLGRFPKDR